jgi:hypothetical protein
MDNSHITFNFVANLHSISPVCTVVIINIICPEGDTDLNFIEKEVKKQGEYSVETGAFGVAWPSEFYAAADDGDSNGIDLVA